MVCVIYGDDIITAENTVSGLLGSEMEILIRKIENFPAGMQSLMMIKSKHWLKIIPVMGHHRDSPRIS